MINEFFKYFSLKEEDVIKKRLIQLFCETISKMNPNENIDNLNYFDIPLPELAEKIIGYIGKV